MPTGLDRLTSRFLNFSEQDGSLSEYLKLLSSLGISVEPKKWIQLNRYLDGWDIRSVFDERYDCHQFGVVWRSLLQRPALKSEQDNKDRVTILGALLFCMDTRADEVNKSLDRVRLRYEYSRREVLLRLSSALYSLGSSLLKRTTQTEQGRAAYTESIAITKEIDAGSMPSNRQMQFYGRRGVALLILSRRDNDEIAHSQLQLAAQDLMRAREFGDETVQHYRCEIETLTRLFILSKDERYLNRALSLAENLPSGMEHPPGLWIVIGDARLANARHLEAQEELRPAVEELQVAVDAYERALSLDSVSDDAKIYYMRQAQAQTKLYTLSNKIEEWSDEEDSLDQIISTYQRAGSMARAEGSAYPTVLLFKADKLIKKGECLKAIDLIDLALSLPISATPLEIEMSVRYRLNVTKAEATVRLAQDAKNVENIRLAISTLLNEAKAEDLSVAIVSGALRDLLDLGLASSDPLFKKGLEALEFAAYSGKHVGDAARFAASHAGRLHIALFGLSDYESMAKAHALFEMALKASDSVPPPELVGWMATTSSLLGEASLRRGEADTGLGFLEDARDYYLKVVSQLRVTPSEHSDLSVIHSKLAVLYLRLHALSSDSNDAQEAINHMHEAISLGGELPARFGHLGDAYYRLGRTKRDPDLLREAIKYKRLARTRRGDTQGDSSRENRSVTAAALVRIWEMTRDAQCLRDAVEEIALASGSDPGWPWPYFQIADVLERIDSDTLKNLVQTDASGDVNSFINGSAGEADKAMLRACELALLSDEFDRKRLGGNRQSQVHVLDDPHNLLNQTVVFKSNSHNVADREIRAIKSLSKVLQERNAPARFLLTQPIGVLRDADKHEWYATRFQRGRDLGRMIYLNAQNIRSLLRDSVHFLALFHVSQGIVQAGQHQPRNLSEEFWSEVVNDITSDFDYGDLSVSNELRRLASGGLPFCRKKDAHPENWLITPNNGIVMMDFEATRKLPVLYEVAQLLEDYPAIRVDDAGWDERIQLCEHYLRSLAVNDELEQLVHSISRIQIERSYAVFALVRAVFGLNRSARVGKKVNSSSALRLFDIRAAHYRNLILAFTQGWGSSDLVSIARHILVGTLT